MICGAASGEGGGADTALAFFGLGLVVLILFGLFYQLTTSFDIHSEIENNNTAVGIAMGGNFIAMGLVIFKAVFGNFDGWNEALADMKVCEARTLYIPADLAYGNSGAGGRPTHQRWSLGAGAG